MGGANIYPGPGLRRVSSYHFSFSNKSLRSDTQQLPRAGKDIKRSKGEFQIISVFERREISWRMAEVHAKASAGNQTK
jgi:hypothetical protein